MKESSYSHKLGYEEYLELIYRCLLNDMFIELTCIRILYVEITYIYEKTHVTIVYVILGLEITKSFYIKKIICFDYAYMLS